ncbi:Malonyl CoA-acyl carrier protein transacylase [Novipirellula galeiformis]|uniref:Malonyl CoA-acyl carrier protein transacylase n=1 Tax=Novipirellula galeiformis TaxID=2528004 RepID=A0A5C6CVI6_9BACT|nr:ACP S-malonyltransferase [Novipirellula galeiformis]TWU26729.1 Malonyl CoA-acyl carrier protein transacylase [Novipirellula galeiformis]
MALNVDSVAILFPGQGAQNIGMGRWLCENYPQARARYDAASEILGYDLAALSFEGPEDKLNATEFCQPALFVVGMAAAEVLLSERPELSDSIKATAGLSLGEYTAVCFAGGIQFEDAVRLVQRRGEAMQAASDAAESGMASILGLDLETAQAVCDECRQGDEVLQPANLLCPGNIAISGHVSALKRVEPVAKNAGAMKTIRLSVAGAFHTPLMQSAVAKLGEALEAIEIQDTRIPVYSNVDAAPHQSAAEIKNLLSRQVVNPVLWEASVRKMMDDGIEGFLEAGTGRVLQGTLKRIHRKLATEGFGDG